MKKPTKMYVAEEPNQDPRQDSVIASGTNLNKVLTEVEKSFGSMMPYTMSLKDGEVSVSFRAMEHDVENTIQVLAHIKVFDLLNPSNELVSTNDWPSTFLGDDL